MNGYIAANRHKKELSRYDRGMSQITKSVRLGGSSADSIEDAIRTVLARAAITIDEIVRFEVVDVGGVVDDAGVPTAFEVTLDITFVVKESVHG